MILSDISEKYYLLGCDTVLTSVHVYTRHNATFLCESRLPCYISSLSVTILYSKNIFSRFLEQTLAFSYLFHHAPCIPHPTASWFIHHNILLLTLCNCRQPFAASSMIFPNNVFSIILVGNQLDAQFLLWYVYLNPLHVSSNYVLILRRTVVLIQLSSWGWAQSCLKHVEDSNKHIIEETVH